MSNSDQNPSQDDFAGGDDVIARTLMWIGVGGLAAAVAYAVVRAIVSRTRSRAADPTSRRIQQLIDEANLLLKTLDDQRHSA